jgi:subtilisin family serine protease
MFLLVMFLLPAAVNAVPSVYGEALAPVLEDADSDELLPVVIMLNPEPNPQEMAQYLAGVRSMDERRSLLWDELSARAEVAQDEILDILHAEEQTGDASRIRSLVLANAVAANLTPAMIRIIAQRTEVRIIEYTPSVNALEPIENPPANELDVLTWHVEQVNADDVWNMGYTGEGVIVAVLDTGVNYNHNDLQNQLWDGGFAYPNHGYDVYHNDNDPMDQDGHGTHVAGIVAGDGTSGFESGVAPDATIMCVKIYSDFGGSSLPDVWAGLDFALQNGAHHTTISSGWYNVSAALHQGNRNNYELSRLAGMTNTKSCGNSGGSPFNTPPEQISAPGWVPSPWTHPDQTEPGGLGGLTAVGSTNSNDNISSYSSHGPVTWESINPWNDYDYNGGASQGLIKPDVSAPGENIYSLSLSNNGYTTKSGTSMASPCAAGVIALIRSINPNLTPGEVDLILQTTALDLGAPGKDNTFGAGRVDALAAATLAGAGLDGLSVTITPDFDPYYIPGNGGSMFFDVNIVNYFEVNTPGNVWTEAILPNGNTYPIQVYNVTFRPDINISVSNVQQYVPANAPEGNYQFTIKAGFYPDEALDVDSFEFSKFNLGTDGVEEWTQTGFEQLMGDAEETVEAVQPGSFELQTAYPNPFNPTTNLSVSLPLAGNLELSVFNTLGQKIASLANGQFNAGQHSFTFDGAGLSSGLYFVQAQMNGGNMQMQKIMLMK